MKNYNEIADNVLLRRDKYEETQIVKRKKIIRISSFASCFVLAVVLSIGIWQGGWFDFSSAPIANPSLQEDDDLETTNNNTTQEQTIYQTGDMAMPHWDDLKICEKFREVTFDEITYSSQVQEISEECILDFISDTEMTGYDRYEDKTYTEKGKIYSIKHISTVCAVAIKIGNENTYYVFINPWYFPETLGDLISDLDLKNTVVFGDVYYDSDEYSKTSSKHTRRTYENVADDVIWNMLLSDTSLKNVEYNHPYDRISVETDLPILGYKNISFSVTTDGYIITNILNDQKCFFVGTEKTDAFADYLEKNVPFKEYTEVYEYNPDGSIPGKSEIITTQEETTQFK